MAAFSLELIVIISSAICAAREAGWWAVPRPRSFLMVGGPLSGLRSGRGL